VQHTLSAQPGWVLAASHVLIASGHTTATAHRVAASPTHALSQAVLQQKLSASHTLLQQLTSEQPGLVLATLQALLAAGHRVGAAHRVAASFTQVWSHAVLQQ
jgi:hypothetical protein